MRTYKMTVAYDGSRFRGWQRQPDTDLTVQGVLERTISELAGYSVEVYGSGRTDGGVHAAGQTISFRLSGKVDEAQFLEQMNKILPEDIRVLNMKLVKNKFHARYNARGKCYEYSIDIGERAGVFSRKYTFHYPHDLDVNRMQTAADILIGNHDFAGFTDRIDEHSTIRRIYNITVKKSGNLVKIEYRGSGFMYHMVRILTGTLLEVGGGERTVESVGHILKNGVRAEAGFLAPACGLCLKGVFYKEEEIMKSVI